MSEDLDEAYANAPYIPDADAIAAAWPKKAQAFRVAMETAGRCSLNVSYGDSSRQSFDVFRTIGEAKGTVIFVHGGYWLRFDRSDWSHLAAGALDAGWDVALPGYDLCPDVALSDITSQIARAVEAIAAREKAEGPIILVGHSAGGHLVARMLDPGLLKPGTLARVRHVMPISPLTDLREMCELSMASDWKLTPANAASESPVLQPAPELPVSIWVGAAERPVFLDHARWLAETWNCGQVVVPDKNHFDVIDDLEDAQSDMLQSLVSVTG